MDNIYGTRFVGARTPGWHYIGEVLSDEESRKISVRQALKRGGIDFKYATAPIGYTLPSGEFVESGNKVVVLREPTSDTPEWTELGFASPDYKFLQNEELAEGLDKIRKATGWTFETIGALGKGEVVFMTLKAGERSVFGDDYENYLIVSDGKVAGRALTIAVAPVRVVCQNTLMASDSASTVRIKIAHGSDVANEYGFWLGYVQELEKAQDSMFKSMEEMASVKIDEDAVRIIASAAYPVPAKNQRAQQAERVEAMSGISTEGKDAMMARLADGVKTHEFYVRFAERHQEAVVELYNKFNEGEEYGATIGRKMKPETLDMVRQTPYAALQGVMEIVDFGGRQNEKIAGTSAVFGEGAKIKARAFDKALEVARSA